MLSDPALPAAPAERVSTTPALSYRAARVLCRVATTCVWNLKVYGAHHVPRSGGVLIASNHQSYLDPVLLGVQLDRPMNYLAKSELFRNRLFGGLLSGLGAFPVRQGAGDVGAMKETISRLQQGAMLTIFPEGSRTENGELLPIQKGVGLIIRRAKVPVVPAIIQGSFQAWPRDRVLPQSRTIRLLYGPPLHLESERPDEIVARIDRVLHEMVARLKAMD